MKRGKLIYGIGSLLFMSLVYACSENSNHPTIDNQPSTLTDTMPVVKPPVNDTGSTIILPEVNDRNAIVPDSSR